MVYTKGKNTVSIYLFILWIVWGNKKGEKKAYFKKMVTFLPVILGNQATYYLTAGTWAKDWLDHCLLVLKAWNCHMRMILSAALASSGRLFCCKTIISHPCWVQTEKIKVILQMFFMLAVIISSPKSELCIIVNWQSAAHDMYGCVDNLLQPIQRKQLPVSIMWRQN